MLLRYSSKIARSAAPSVRRSFVVSAVTESSRLCFSASRAWRCSGEPVSPNIRSNVTRGLIDTGSGRSSSRHASVSKIVHGNPSQAPAAVPMSSVPTSIDRSGVSPPTVSAMYWSSVFFDRSWPNASPVSSRATIGPTPLRNAELAPTCTDSPHGAFILLIVTSWLR